MYFRCASVCKTYVAPMCFLSKNAHSFLLIQTSQRCKNILTCTRTLVIIGLFRIHGLVEMLNDIFVKVRRFGPVNINPKILKIESSLT
jgi:hypothetical protein